jgi:thioredoxin-related protein
MPRFSYNFLVTATVLFGSFALASTVRGDEKEKEDLWTTDFEAAKAQAKAENKLLLVDFTGSDWCIWCKRLHGEVMDKDEFKTEAPKKFVLVELDFPNDKSKQSDELQAQNKKLLKQYKIQGYPTVLLMDPKGEVVAHTGYQPGGPEKYVKQLDGFLDVYATIVKMKHELESAKGLARAKLLDKIIDAYVELNNETDQLTAWSKEIIKLDADNNGGLRSKHEFRLCMAEGDQLMQNRKIVDALAAFEKALAIEGISGDQKKTAQSRIDQLKPIVEALETLAKLKPQLETAEGLDRAKLLDKLVQAQSKCFAAMPSQKAMMDASQNIQKWSKEIVDLDTDNKAGLRNKYAFQVKFTEAITHARSGDFAKARATLDEAAAVPELNDRQKNMIEQLRKQLPKEKEQDSSSKDEK